MQEKPEARFPSIAIFVESLDAKLAADKTSASFTKSARSRGQAYALPVVLMVACSALLGRHFLGNERQRTMAGQPDEAPVSSPARSSSTQTTAASLAKDSATIEQPGALPFRVTDNGDIEVLIVQARTGKHWTIPKATQKTRRSLESTAEEEAYDEGRVHGAAIPVVLGNYE